MRLDRAEPVAVEHRVAHHQHAGGARGGFGSSTLMASRSCLKPPRRAAATRARPAAPSSTPMLMHLGARRQARGPSTCTLPLGERGFQRPQPAAPYSTTSGQSIAPAMWRRAGVDRDHAVRERSQTTSRCSVGFSAAPLTTRPPAGGVPGGIDDLLRQPRFARPGAQTSWCGGDAGRRCEAACAGAEAPRRRRGVAGNGAAASRTRRARARGRRAALTPRGTGAAGCARLPAAPACASVTFSPPDRQRSGAARGRHRGASPANNHVGSHSKP